MGDRPRLVDTLFQIRVQSYKDFLICANKIFKNIYFLSPMYGRCYRVDAHFLCATTIN